MQKRIPRDYQQQLINEYFTCLHAGYNAPVIILPTGGGKCLGKGTPVILADGAVIPVENVKVGDQLMGPDSRPRNVLSLARGQEELFRVTPVKGDSYVVNRSHILSTRHTKTGEIVNLSIDEWLNSSKTFKHCHKGWRTGITFEKPRINDQYLTPYFLGLWLGDGHSNIASITTADDEVVEYLFKFAESTGQHIRIQDQVNNKSKVYHVINNWTRGKTLTSLRDNDLLNNKHIPHDYLTANRSDRMALLAGLVDSDGYLHHGGYDFVFKSERLANDVAWLCRSLGLAAYLKPCQKSIKSIGFTGDYFRISVSGDLSDVPVKLPRHKCEPRKQKKNVLNTGITVESIGTGDYYGFEIDGDHLFLLGDFTVTHNTMIFSTIVRMMAEAGNTCLIVCHRSELVRQISMSLAMEDIHHDFICSDKTRAICGNVQQSTFGRTYYRAGARVIVASVQTINSRIKETDKMSESRKRVRAATLALLKTITFGVFDESHHLLRDNTFGRPVPLMPLAKYLLVTATPTRTDGRGMGSVALGGSGIVDVTIMGPQMRWLIDSGYLCDYKIFEPPTEQADFTKVRVTKSGDYNLEDQAHEMNKATITGDVVRHYKEMINGKLTIVFCCDIAHAISVADAYQSAGIPAAVLHGGDDELTRFKTLQAFERREILVLVTVDLVSEGFDLPAIEAAQFLRRTMSLSWWIQAFGRVLRPSPGKEFAYILDHVGNWREQGLPDKPREWPMADRKGGSSKEDDPDDIPVTRCRAYIDKSGRFSSEQCAQFTAEERNDRGITICGFIYEITNTCCPECGQHQPLAPRGEPIVDKTGKLIEVSAEELAKMRAGDDLISDQAAMWRQEIQQDLMLLQMTPEKYVASLHAPAISHHNHMERHRMWRQLQAQLRTIMDEWMQYHQNAGIGKEAAQELFLRRFGTNVYYAQVLRNKDCGELMTKIEAHLAEIHDNGGLTYN